MTGVTVVVVITNMMLVVVFMMRMHLMLIVFVSVLPIMLLMLVVVVSVEKPVVHLFVPVQVDSLHEHVEPRLQGFDPGEESIVVILRNLDQNDTASMELFSIRR